MSEGGLKNARGGEGVLAELAVFVGPTIVIRGATGISGVYSRLTGYAASNTGQRFSARFRNGAAAFFAVKQAFTGWEPATRVFHCIFDVCVDLFLNGPLWSPTYRHSLSLARTAETNNRAPT